MLSTKDTFLLIIVNMKYFKLTHNSKFNKKFKYKLNQSLEPAITEHFITIIIVLIKAKKKCYRGFRKKK